MRTLDGIADGTLEARPQPTEGVSLAPKIEVEDAQVDWSWPALAIDRQVRACSPDPGAWSTYDGDRIKLGPVRIDAGRGALDPGVLDVTKSSVSVGTGTDAVLLGDVVPFGKRRMSAADWARGARVASGARLG